MDSNAALTAIIDALKDGDPWGTAKEDADTLLQWLYRGGSMPTPTEAQMKYLLGGFLHQVIKGR